RRLSVLVTHSQNCVQELEPLLRRAVVIGEGPIEPNEYECRRCGLQNLGAPRKHFLEQKLNSGKNQNVHEELHEAFMKLCIALESVRPGD
ncbi:MAG: hypothetical protein ACO3L0_06955, partial [Vulcanococcus sp.]